VNTFKVFLFPLPKLVYQPVLAKPLRIFEPRYLEMVNEAIKRDIPIALCHGLASKGSDCIEIDHESLHFCKRIVGVGYPQIVQKDDDKSELLIMISPFTKAEIISIESEDRPFNVALAEECIEFETVLPHNMIKLKTIELEFKKWANLFFTDEAQLSDILESFSDPLFLVAAFSEFVIQSQEAKQQILELDDVNDKIDFIIKFITESN
jgi:Lon protease-like protein